MHTLQKARYVAGILFGPRGSAARLRRSASVAQVAARQGAELYCVYRESRDADRRKDHAKRQRVAEIHEAHVNGMASLDECLNAMFGNDVKPRVILRVIGDAR